MEAPEKIYINPLPNPSDGYVGIAWDEPHKTMVEYTRTDAFIDKACEYMHNHIDPQLTIYHEQIWKKRDEFIRDFKSAMEKLL